MIDCGKRYRTKTTFIEHIRFEHGEDILSNKDNKVLNTLNNIKILCSITKDTLNELENDKIKNNPEEMIMKKEMVSEMNNMMFKSMIELTDKISEIYELYFLKTK